MIHYYSLPRFKTSIILENILQAELRYQPGLLAGHAGIANMHET